jgi:hypothetical protein
LFIVDVGFDDGDVQERDTGPCVNADERQIVRTLLRASGAEGPIRMAKQKGGDELVIVLSSSVATWAGMNEGVLTQKLQDLLHRKVWIVTDSPVWEDQTEEL